MLNFTLHFSLIFMDKNKLPISPFKQSSKLSRVKGPQGHRGSHKAVYSYCPQARITWEGYVTKGILNVFQIKCVGHQAFEERGCRLTCR